MHSCWRSPPWKARARLWEQNLQRASTNAGAVDRGVLIYADPRIGVELRPSSDQPAFLLLEFSEPFEARSLTAYAVPIPGAPGPSPEHGSTPIWLEVSDDGAEFRKVCDLDWGDSGDGISGVSLYGELLQPCGRKFYRVVSWHRSALHRLPYERRGAPTPLDAQGQLHAQWQDSARTPWKCPKDRSSIPPRSSILLATWTSTANSTWDAPEGTWMVLRIGQTTTGVQNHPAPDGGLGTRVRQVQPRGLRLSFRPLLWRAAARRSARLAAQGLAGGLIDSYETGMQNWTRDFPQEFAKRRGYDLVNTCLP